MSAPGSALWLSRHEGRLAWRDLRYLLTAGGRWRIWNVTIILVLVVALLHLVAYRMVKAYAGETVDAGPAVYAGITTSIGLSFFLTLSQGLEQVTRLFYARGDLDLLKSSPISLRKVFTLRVGSIAISTTAMAMLVTAPFANMLALYGGWHWLSAYGVAAGAGLSASGLALIVTAVLFDTMGPRRTRLASQVVSAVVGSAFIIGIQAIAILSIGTLSQEAFFESDIVTQNAPAPGSAFWIPARAVLGDPWALVLTVCVGAVALVIPMLLVSGRLADYALAAAGVDHGEHRRQRSSRSFRSRNPAQLLRRKEWILLIRDPWLASQSLMQVLYLLPPALLLWRSYGDSKGALVVLASVLTMAAGQLAGGLAWLAVSGEDAPDLIDTAPLPPRQAIMAKMEAVLLAILCVFAPFLFAMLLRSWEIAIFTGIGIAMAALSSTMIQIWFRSQAKRRYFRRRQTSSRIATFAEAFASVAWAAAAGVAAHGSWQALVPIGLAFVIMTGAWAIRPR